MSSPTMRHKVAAELRAEMARQNRTGIELAALLGCSQQSASRRTSGLTGLDLDEAALIADWLGVTVADLIPADRPDAA